MFGTASEQMVVSVSASEAWKIFGTLQLAKMAGESLPQLFQKIEVVEGDGGVGTIINVSFSSGQGTSSNWKEKYIIVDDEKRVKEVEVVEGGYLDMGFIFYRIRFEVIEDGENSCIIKATIDYEVAEEFAAYKYFVCYNETTSQYNGICCKLLGKQIRSN